jgi:hypothetical protein
MLLLLQYFVRHKHRQPPFLYGFSSERRSVCILYMMYILCIVCEIGSLLRRLQFYSCVASRLLFDTKDPSAAGGANCWLKQRSDASSVV